MKKIVAILGTIAAGIVLAVIPSGTADASVVQTYGHNDTWWDIHGDISCGTCNDRAVRVGVELRRLSEGNLDMNVCVDPIAAAGVARASIDSENIIKDGTTTIGSSTPGVIRSTYFCVDLDPNVGVCGPTRSSTFLAHADVGVRRTDNILLHVFGNSDNNTTMPCD